MKQAGTFPTAELRRLLPGAEIRFDEKTLREHAGDKWFASHLPDAVAFPKNSASISKLLRFAHERKIPVTARGAGYGYVGGCVPSRGGIVLSLIRMNRIKEVALDDFVAVVEPGVITKQLQDKVESLGRYYPPDPASRADCTLGGNIATNAGGPRCLKYGVTRDYVLGLEVVLANGNILRLGGRTHKNKTGFDLVKLFVGSEGMLGVVTEATLKLLPLPPFRAALALGFANMASAVEAIRVIFACGFLPSALELADAFTLDAARKRTGSPLLAGCQAHIIVELDGQEPSVRSEIKKLRATVSAAAPLTTRCALGAAACEEFWGLRREFSYALRDTGLTKLNEDIVVPRGKLEALFKFTARLQKKYNLPVACFGHAGDGNIHVNIMVDRADSAASERSELALDDLFREVLRLGGVITGEHGIGLAKKTWWPLAASPEVQQLHHAIKDACDPHRILNPGKFLN